MDDKGDLVMSIETVTAKDLSQEQRALVLDKLLEVLHLQVGVMKTLDGEKVVFREIKQ